MAHNFEPDPSMPTLPDSSPSDILGDIKIRRSLVKIPSYQKQLLSRNESWASFLGRRPGGFVNVPPDVLTQLKASYKRQKQATHSPKPVASPSHVGDDVSAPEPSGSQSSSPLRAERDGEDNDGDDSDEDSSDRYTPSPERNLRPPSVRSQESNQPFMTQLPEISLPKPTIATSPSLPPSPPPPPEHLSKLEFPQSSPGPEDELEVGIPGALPYDPEPVNKSAVPLLATPPSAQVVPCTFEQSMQSTDTTTSTKSGPQSKPRPKKHIYKPVPQLYRGPKQAAPSHLSVNVGPSRAETVPSQDNEAESSLSTGNTSSSIIPSTANELNPQIEKQTTIWDAGPGQVSTHDADSGSINSRNPLAHREHSTMYTPASPSLVIRSPKPLAPFSHPVAPPALAAGTWEAPFIHYTVTYPGYNGTIQDFVTACMYIQSQYRRIRTSLYDDFIRAWVEGYLPYVKDCDEAQPHRKALRAIEWYNEIDDDPLFTSRVVTRQNLQSILNFYPIEQEMARRSFGIASSRGPSEYSVSGSHAEPYGGQDKGISSQPPRHAQQLNGGEPIQKLGGVARLEARPSPPAKAQALPFISNQHIPAHKSLSGIETRAVQPKSLARSSFSESITDKKRAASNELRSEGAKRVSLGPSSGTHSRMRSDSGSTGSSYPGWPRDTPRSSVAPESTMGRKSAKSTEDPEERRRRRLAKHFKKQMAGRESIASSAPIGSTPMPGQKY